MSRARPELSSRFRTPPPSRSASAAVALGSATAVHLRCLEVHSRHHALGLGPRLLHARSFRAGESEQAPLHHGSWEPAAIVGG